MSIERELLAQWMIRNGYATGHGETTLALIGELDWQHRGRQQDRERLLIAIAAADSCVHFRKACEECHALVHEVRVQSPNSYAALVAAREGRT